jgi:hypothetical protein
MADAAPAPNDPSDSPIDGLDRRSGPRHAADVLISCRPLALPKDANLAAVMKDVSPRGLSLLLRYQFQPGTLLAVDISDAGGDRTERVLAQVVHVRQREGGKWLHGCSLQHELTEQQLQLCRADADGESWVRVAAAALP